MTAPANGEVVSLRGVTKQFGEVTAVAGSDLTVYRREFFTLLGPSGSGKTTILRMIAGFIEPTSGEVFIDGENMAGKRPYERNIGMVFQSLALFSHMDVFGNIAFPLRMRRVARKEIERRVRESLEIVRLTGIEHRKITELSGGQRQRIALARALVYRPLLLLLDEPLGALDRRLREDMQIELVRLHREVDVTIINVTHDQREALMLSDRVGVMHDGRIVHVDTADELYLSPTDVFVASFVGDSTLVDGDLVSENGRTWLAAGGIRLAVEARATTGSATLVLRSEVLSVVQEVADAAGADNKLRGRIEVAVFEGGGMFYEISVESLRTVVKATVPWLQRSERFSVGDEVWVAWRSFAAPVIAR